MATRTRRRLTTTEAYDAMGRVAAQMRADDSSRPRRLSRIADGRRRLTTLAATYPAAYKRYTTDRIYADWDRPRDPSDLLWGSAT